MNIEKIKEMLKNKKVIVASSAVILLVVIGAITLGVVHSGKNKVEDNKAIVETTKENDNIREKEVKDKLEELKKIDISRVSEEDKKILENKIVEIEKLIENKEYTNATTSIESLKKEIDTKLEEVVKNEEIQEESKDEKVEENKEVASNDTTSNSTSSNTSSNTSENSGNTSSSNQEVVQHPTTPPVVEEKPVESIPTPTPEPTPQPPVVEEPKPVYPSVSEVQQRLIAYGQSLGLTYDPSLVSNGWQLGATEQMWSSERGNSADQQRLFNGLINDGFTSFAIVATDLGNGFCRMEIYAPW